MEISCSDCVMQHTTACDDCVVTHVLSQNAGGVVFDLATERAVRLLTSAGLVPASHHRSA